MPEYEFTRGTQLLLSGTILLLFSWITTFIFHPDEPAIFFTIIPLGFAAIATYSAATDSDWGLFNRWGTNTVTVRSQYIGNTSAVSVWSFVTIGFLALDLVLWILILDTIQLNSMHTLAIVLTILGGILVIVGGFLAHQEWGE